MFPFTHIRISLSLAMFLCFILPKNQVHSIDQTPGELVKDGVNSLVFLCDKK